jgi:hypothetical protein
MRFVNIPVQIPNKVRQSNPATRHGGAWGERRYSSSSFLTSVLDGDEWSASRPGRALPPGKGPPVPIVQEARWAPEPVWTQRLEENSSASVGDRTPIVQPVARYYTDWATAVPQIPNAKFNQICWIASEMNSFRQTDRHGLKEMCSFYTLNAY